MRRILPTALSLLAFAAVAAPNRFSLVRSDSGDAEDDSAAVFSLDEATLRLACVEEAPDRAAEGAPVVAILCHGLAGRKEGALFDAVSKALRAKGVAVARFDFNGHGESEGAFGRMTVSNEVLDAETVVDYYRNVRGARVALVGHSQGGVVAALAASRLGAETVEALALLAPAGVLRDDALRGAFFGARYDPLDPPASVPLGDTGLAVGREYLLDAQETDPYAEIARYRGPLVVAHGQADTVVPWTYGQRFVDAVPGTGELVLVRPADHSFKGWEDTVAGVVADFLARSFGLAEGAEASVLQEETHAESAESAEAPVAQEETHAESAEGAEAPVPQEETHAEPAEVAEAPVAQEETHAEPAEAPVPQEETHAESAEAPVPQEETHAESAEEHVAEPTPDAGGTETPVDLPPDIRADMQNFLHVLDTQASAEPASSDPVVPADPVMETHAESAEVAETSLTPPPVPEETHTENVETDSVATPAFDALVAMYAENNGFDPKTAREILTPEAKAWGLSCEAYALKVIDEAGLAFDESGKLVEKPKEGEAPAAVRGDEVAATEPMAAAEPAAMVPQTPAMVPQPQTVAELAAAYPSRPVDAKSSVINILAAPNGFTWQGLEVEKEDLIDRLRIFGKSIPEAHVRISTYPETPFETVRDIIDAAKDAGFAHLSVSVPSVSVPRTAP